jgi:hypothetical protein
LGHGELDFLGGIDNRFCKVNYKGLEDDRIERE